MVDMRTSPTNKARLLNHVKRTRGQLSFVERVLRSECKWDEALMQLAAARGSLASLMAELFEDCLRCNTSGRLASHGEREFVAAYVHGCSYLILSYLRERKQFKLQ
jgi:DNA-binding FrmR family transcriptional regulator